MFDLMGPINDTSYVPEFDRVIHFCGRYFADWKEDMTERRP